MDAATKTQISGLVFTVLLPVAAAALPIVVARKLKPGAAERPLLGGLAVLAGLVTAHLGVVGWPGWPLGDAHHWVLLAVIGAAALGLLVDRLQPPARPLVVGAVALVVLAFFTWRLLAPLAGLWDEKGVLPQLSQSAWVLDAGLMMLVAWLGVDHAARRAPAPAVLAPVALAFAAAAGAVVISGSAIIGQLAGAMGVAVALVGVAAWRWPDVRVGHGAVGAAIVGLGLVVSYGHFYVDMPRPVAGLLVLAPLGALGGLLGARTWQKVALALALAAVPAATAGWLAKQADAAAMEEDGGGGEYEYDYGSL